MQVAEKAEDGGENPRFEVLKTGELCIQYTFKTK